MMDVELDTAAGIATLIPHTGLEKSDFIEAAAQIDPCIEERGGLAGLIVLAEQFPGWDSFGALVSHLSFVREHHQSIARLAFVTDSAVGGFAEKIGNHFVSAEIKEFPYADLEAARSWILSGE